MTIEKGTVTLQGWVLHRLILEPSGPPVGGLVFFHGQGDFIDRYPPVLRPFVDAGYRCLLTDLPGHGRSPGKRGDVPGLALVDELVAESLTHLDGPLIIAGHSMGGLMALRLFLRHPHQFAGAWFSSPLLNVLDRAHPVLARVLPWLAKITPKITVGTGVTPDQCGDFSDTPRSDSGEREALYHSRISLRWGLDLVRASDAVWSQGSRLPVDGKILITQGDEDPVCPPGVLHEFLAQSRSEAIQPIMIQCALHEPFEGATREDFLALLETWLKEHLGLSQR